MQKSTTIIGVLEMLGDGFSYNDIRTRYAIGNSTITDINKKFKTMDVTLKQLHSMTPKLIEQMFYPNVSIPLSEVHAICYRSPHNPLKKSIFFKS